MRDWILPLSAIVCLFAARAISQDKRLPYPSATAAESRYSCGMRDVAFLSLGARRLGADVAFIDLLQYYGRHENENEDPNAGFYVYGLKPPPSWKMEGGVYPELLVRAKRVLWLDPYFRFAVFYTASALAFNLNRPQEALEVLNEGRKWLPKEWKYEVLTAAIGYSKAGDPSRQAAELDRVISDPDAPDLLRQLAAFLNKKAGNLRRAYEIYGMLLHSSDEGYASNAETQRRALERQLKNR